MRRNLELLCIVMFPVALLNFALFAVVSLSLGGDAINGKVVNGHYYLASHGELTEVSRTVWLYMKAHAISVIGTMPIGLLGIWLLARSQWDSGLSTNRATPPTS